VDLFAAATADVAFARGRANVAGSQTRDGLSRAALLGGSGAFGLPGAGCDYDDAK